MKSTALLFIALGFSWAVFGQALNLPRQSPKASVSYTVGLTEVTINYSAPAAKDRKLWGDLLPYGEVWRAGANEATIIEFSTDVMIEGKTLDAGKYAFFLLPRKSGTWTAIFNKKWNQWGAYDYNEEEDALRVEVDVKTDAGKSQERLFYRVTDNGTLDKGVIALAWGTTRVHIDFSVEVKERAMRNIEKNLPTIPEDRQWQAYGQAAEFLMDVEEYDKALGYARKSTQLGNHAWNWWLRAKIEAQTGDYKAAYASAEKAKAFGIANDNNYYKGNKDDIERALEDWKGRM